MPSLGNELRWQLPNGKLMSWPSFGVSSRSAEDVLGSNTLVLWKADAS